MKDLFETPELIPQQVQNILNTFDDSENDYQELQRLVSELEAIGYTFDFYLDAEPYGLRPMGTPLEALEGFND